MHIVSSELSYCHKPPLKGEVAVPSGADGGVPTSDND